MTRSEIGLCTRTLFWGYFFLYFDLNLGTLDILPGWLGGLMLFSALNRLAPAWPSLALLRPFALILTVQEGYNWLGKLLGDGLPTLPGWLNLLLGLVTLYFNFQLFTDLVGLVRQRGVAPDGQPPRGKGLLAARTVQALLHTALLLDPLLLWLTQHEAFVFAGLAVYLAVIVVILYQLFTLKRFFPPEEDGTP